MKVVITNTVLLNTGDAAILFGLIKVLRESFGDKIDILVLDSQPKAARKYYPELEFDQLETFDGTRTRLTRFLARFGLRRMLEWVAKRTMASPGFSRLSHIAARNFAAYRSADLVVSTGGTYLVERYGLAGRFAQLALALESGRPVVLFTQSLGPFNNPAYRYWLSKELHRFQGLFLRDQASLSNLESLGAPLPRAFVVADAAFALGDEVKIGAAARAGASPVRMVAISVRRWDYFVRSDGGGASRYAETIRALVTWLVEEGIDVTFLSTCQGVPEYWADDSGVAEEYVGTLPAQIRKAVTVDRSRYRPETLMERLGDFDVVVATRMHMAILALSVGVPVFAIAYEAKTKQLFGKLGFEKWVEHIDEVDPVETTKRLRDFLSALPALRKPLFDAVLKEHRSAEGVAVLLKNCIAPDER